MRKGNTIVFGTNQCSIKKVTDRNERRKNHKSNFEM